MHPVIRIICFLVLAGFVAFGGRYELALGFLVVLGVILAKRLQSIELSLRIIKRMRWLFLSILVVYLWFTPGQPLIPYPHVLVPSVEGLRTGLLRVFTLVLIILAVNYFVAAIARSKLVEAITWLLYPLNWIAIDNRLLALRIALTLELIPRVQQIVLDMKQIYLSEKSNTASQNRLSIAGRTIARLASISRLVEILFERVIDAAINMPEEALSIDTKNRPPLLQWLIPLLLASLFLWVHHLN